MKIADEWIEYIDKLDLINGVASDYLKEYIELHGIDENNREALIKCVNALVFRYGETAGACACNMYDKIAADQGVKVPLAEPAEIVPYEEVAKAVNGAINQSPSGKLLPQILQRFTKQAGTDTIIKNSIRDNASFAWVPGGGDTCPYCLMLAGTGWHRAGKKTLQGKYVGHIHANCKCTYAIDFNGTLEIEGYDPEKYDKIVRDCFGEDFGAEELLDSTWNNKKGKADYKLLNEFRNYIAKQRVFDYENMISDIKGALSKLIKNPEEDIINLFKDEYKVGKLINDSSIASLSGKDVYIDKNSIARIINKHGTEMRIDEIRLLNMTLSSPDVIADNSDKHSGSFLLYCKIPNRNKYVMETVVVPKEKGGFIIHFHKIKKKKIKKIREANKVLIDNLIDE